MDMLLSRFKYQSANWKSKNMTKCILNFHEGQLFCGVIISIGIIKPFLLTFNCVHNNNQNSTITLLGKQVREDTKETGMNKHHQNSQPESRLLIISIWQVPLHCFILIKMFWKKVLNVWGIVEEREIRPDPGNMLWTQTFKWPLTVWVGCRDMGHGWG